MTSTTITTRPKAYSYIRFSTPEQMKGDSLRRQTDAAERYAALHGLELDDSLTFRDLGKSAYRGANTDTGHLGEFLAFVESRDIAPDSYLLVESLDRLSRQPPMRTLKLLSRICETGITVVTLDDGRAYTEAVLDSDATSLLVALMVAVRAHEESAKKGKRVGAAWSNKRVKAREEGRPMTALCPGWMRLREDRTGYDLIEDRATIVRRVFDWTVQGRGQHWIADTLNREGVPVFGRGARWHRSYVKKMLHDRSTIGTYTPHRKVNGKRIPEEPIEGYFPAVIDRDVFERVEELRRLRDPATARNTAVVSGRITHLLAGLAKCPRCGETMTRVMKGKRSRPTYVCVKAKTGSGCQYKAVPVEDTEDAIIRNAYKFTVELPSADEQWQNKRTGLETLIDVMGDEIEKVVVAIGQSGHSRALLDRLAELEAIRDAYRADLSEVEGKIAAALTNRLQASIGRLDGALEAGDVVKANSELRGLFEKVEIDWPRGQLCFHWKHAPMETTGIMYAWPVEE